MRFQIASSFKIVIIFLLAKLNFGMLRRCEENGSKYLKYLKSNIGENYKSVFFNFKNFSQLNGHNCSHFYNITNYLEFIPNRKLLLDDSFSVSDMFSLKQIISIDYIQILNLKGIDINIKPYINNILNSTLGTLLIFSSKFEFYSKGSLIDSSQDCNLRKFNNTTRNLFNSFKEIQLINNVFPQVLCPFIFKHSAINTLIFGGITNSLLQKNRLHFLELNETHNASDLIQMNSLESIILSLYYERLDQRNLNSPLFKRLAHLTIGGVPSSIQDDLFRKFISLTYIDFQLDNLREFFQTGNKWFTSLNVNVDVKLDEISDPIYIVENVMLLKFYFLKSLVSFNPEYEYPDEDLCLFKDFPHNNLVFPFIVTGKILKCTCTIKWLHLYSDIYQQIFRFNATLLYCNDGSFNVTKCNFQKRFRKCQLNEAAYKKEAFFKRANDVDILFLIKWLQFILLVVLQPILCFIGIINNALNLVIIGNKTKRKDFKDTMYLFIQINSVFNILYCSILISKLANMCLFNEASVFCSSVYLEDSSQYFKLVVSHYLGNAIKLSSNVSYVMFSLSRLILITCKKKKTAFKKRINVKFGIFFVGILFLSCILSLFTLFQYKLNEEKDFRKDFPMEIRDDFYCTNSKEANVRFQCNLFKSFKIAKSAVNDVLLVFPNILIDILLLKQLHRQMDYKSLHVVDFDHPCFQ